MSLPGVGRKTANVVMSVGFGAQRIAVDTHVTRLAKKIGFTNKTWGGKRLLNNFLQ